jgi:hypothetical protein
MSQPFAERRPLNGLAPGQRNRPPVLTQVPPRRRTALATPLDRRRRGRRIVAIARISLLAFVVLIAWTAVSYVSAMMAPSNIPLTIRTVEWVRDSGGAALVDLAERLYYSATAPTAGGPGLTSLPATATGAVASTAAPPRVAVPISPALPGEGVWSGTGSVVSGAQAVRVTMFRPEAAYPRQVAYAAWIDTSRARLELYAGRKQPPNANPRGTMQVPPQLRAGLLATFNSGFTYKDSRGGFAAPGQTASSLADAMILAGAVRAMQLDINSYWPTFNFYDGPGAAGARMLVPNPSQTAARLSHSRRPGLLRGVRCAEAGDRPDGSGKLRPRERCARNAGHRRA